MRNLLRSPLRRFGLVAAVAAIGVAPAAAPAAETTAEPPAESANPPTTGWIPQDPGTEDSGGGVAPTRQGSALGSGGSSNQAGSTSKAPPPEEQPAPSEPPPSTTTSSGSYEAELPPPAPLEEPASAPVVESSSAPEPPAKEVTPKPVGRSGLDSATALARTESTESEDPTGVSQVAGVSLSSAEEQAGSGTNGLLWPALIVCALVLIYAGTRLVLGPVEPNLFRSGPLRHVRRTGPRA